MSFKAEELGIKIHTIFDMNPDGGAPKDTNQVLDN